MKIYITGTLHAADFSYWTKQNNRWDVHDRQLTPETNKMIRTFTQMIGAFAKTG